MIPTRGVLKTRLFYAYCPDATNALPKRLEVRPTHIQRAQQDTKDGILEFGRAFLPPPSSALHTDPALHSGMQPMAGSIMFFRMNTLEEVWKRIRDDVYWKEGVWDRERTDVGEFAKVPGDD